MISEEVRAKLDTLPTSPGVYVFRDAKGGVLYVGKARSLRSRVRSYFQPGSTDVRAFVARLESELSDIETFVVATEKEAALLENQLIKEHQPRYNVKLRDDKEFLSLRLNPASSWPRLEVVRRPKPDRALYFGPYHSASSARQTLRLVNRHFQLRTCTDAEMKSRVRPCLQYQIRRCPGPCVYEVDSAAYGEQVRNVALFLEGRHDELVESLEERMKQAAQAMEYERAAAIRDQLRAVSRVREEQHVASVRDVDQDVIGVYRQADQAQVAVLEVRRGRLVGVRTYELRQVSLPESELVASFVTEYYAGRSSIPDEVLLPMAIEAMDGLGEMLSERRDRKVVVLVPQRGPRVRLVAMATQNAEHAFREKRRAEEDVEARLEQVMERLSLPRIPRRIECIDVSHIGGEDVVAAITVLSNGVPNRKAYRGFHVRKARGGDDYGAMYEVLGRRFRRGREGQSGWELPDLLLVDGGKGQLNVALAVLSDLAIADVPVAALAKEKENVLGEKLVDRVYRPGQKNPVALRSSPALAMLALVRDEAHRFSNGLREKTGTRRRFKSDLDAIDGIGPRTRGKLLKVFGSARAAFAASEEELVRAGLNKAQASAVRAAAGAEELGDELESAEEAAIAHAFEGGEPEEAAADDANLTPPAG